MKAAHADITLCTHGASQVPALMDALVDVWAEAHAGRADDLSTAALRRQIQGHTRHSGFTLVAAYASSSIVGFGYAFPCSPEYWFGVELLPRIPQEARSGRLMGLCELAVRPGRQSQGIGTRMHDELIRTIAPAWSSLLALPSNDRGRSLYERLGYRYAGPYRNHPEGTVFDLLLLHVAPTAA